MSNGVEHPKETWREDFRNMLADQARMARYVQFGPLHQGMHGKVYELVDPVTMHPGFYMGTVLVRKFEEGK